MNHRNYLVALVLAAAALCASLPAAAQDYPAKPMRVIASSAAGGISDIFMRTLGDELHKRWGQPVIIENRPGGNFNIGSRACAEAPPDGYTICIMSNEAVTYNLYLYKKLPFDLEGGIVPLTNLFFLTQALAVSADLERTYARRSRRGRQGAAEDAELLGAGGSAGPVHGGPQPAPAASIS